MSNDYLIVLLESAIQKVKADELSTEQSQNLWNVLTKIPLPTNDLEKSNRAENKQLLRYLFTGWWISNCSQSSQMV